MIRVTDVQYARVSVPDLGLAEEFLTDLGPGALGPNS